MTARILLADADPTLCEVYCDYLTARGFAVRTAVTGLSCDSVQWKPLSPVRLVRYVETLLLERAEQSPAASRRYATPGPALGVGGGQLSGAGS
jgi:hypothetical protein